MNLDTQTSDEGDPVQFVKQNNAQTTVQSGTEYVWVCGCVGVACVFDLYDVTSTSSSALVQNITHGVKSLHRGV